MSCKERRFQPTFVFYDILEVRQRKNVSNSHLNKLSHHFGFLHSFYPELPVPMDFQQNIPPTITRPLLPSHNHSDASISACLHLLGVSGRFIVITGELAVIRGGRTCLFKAQASQPCAKGRVIREDLPFPFARNYRSVCFGPNVHEAWWRRCTLDLYTRNCTSLFFYKYIMYRLRGCRIRTTCCNRDRYQKCVCASAVHRMM